MTSQTATGVLPRFGLFLSQASRTLEQTYEDFALADELGFDHAWLVDHLVDTDGPPEAGCHEAWTLLAALAARTSRVRLGVLVTSMTFRHPALLAKEAATVDHISGGRLILGLGTGWHADEHERYGVELPEPAERVDRFEEYLEVVTSLLENERTTHHGPRYRLTDARLEPRPLQQPRIPILIAAHRPRMLRLAARFADQWDTFPELAGTATHGVSTPLAERVAHVEAACRELGRDPATLRRSTWGRAEVLRSPSSYRAFVQHQLDLGFTDVSVSVPADGTGRDVLTAIARDVLPALRATG